MLISVIDWRESDVTLHPYIMVAPNGCWLCDDVDSRPKKIDLGSAAQKLIGKNVEIVDGEYNPKLHHIGIHIKTRNAGGGYHKATCTCGYTAWFDLKADCERNAHIHAAKNPGGKIRRYLDGYETTQAGRATPDRDKQGNKHNYLVGGVNG